MAGLKQSTPAARRAVYDELRTTLKEEVRAAAPFMPVQTVVAKRRELENAIIAVERLAAKSDPPPPPPPKFVKQPSPPPEVMEITAETPQSVADEQPPETVSSAETEAKPASVVPAGVVPIVEYLVEIPQAAIYSSQSDDRAQRSSGQTAPVPEEHTRLQPQHEEARQVAEFAPPDEEEVGLRPARPLAVYIGAAAVVIGAILVAVVMFTGSTEPPVKQAAKGRVTPVPSDSQLAIRPSDIPPAPPAAVEMIKSAGFGPAAQNSLKEANTLLARGDWERAIASYDDAIRLDPTQPMAFGSRAFAHWSRGNAAAAVRDYGEALRLQPGNIAYRLNRAVGYNRLGEYERAIADLNEVIRAEPANFDALSSRCWAHALYDHLKEALADCNEALKLKPKDVNTLDSRGLVHLKLGRLDRAVADYNAALRIDPKLVSSLYGRGLAKIGRGDRAGGNEDVAAARAAAPDIQATFARYGVR